MKQIYHVSYCDDYGEADAFYDENNVLLSWWSNNDASWSQEHMSDLLENLGIVVLDGNKKHEKAFKKYMKDLFE